MSPSKLGHLKLQRMVKIKATHVERHPDCSYNLGFSQNTSQIRTGLPDEFTLIQTPQLLVINVSVK